MAKLTNEQLMEIYQKWKESYSVCSISREYSTDRHYISYVVKLIDKYGQDILRKDKNNYYSVELKQEAINEVLIGKKTIRSVAIEYGLLRYTTLSLWIKSYKENGYVIVEKKRGRKTTMTTNFHNLTKYKEMSDKEKIKYLEERNLYLEAENEYIKKLDAVIQKEELMRQNKK